MILRLRDIPATLSPVSWVYLLVTWFHAGRVRPASGSWGTVAAVPCCLIVQYIGGMWGLIGFAIILYAVGIIAIRAYSQHTTSSDPSEVVIDEVLGMALVCMATPLLDWRYVLVGFILLRIVDSLKPGPIGWVDRTIKGAHGVMLDDVVGGAIVALMLLGYRFLSV